MASGTVKVKASSGLNVRAKATTNAAAIGLLSNGKQVGYSNEVNGWLQINHNGRQGYISKKYTVPVSSGASAPKSTSTTSTKTVKTTASSLNVRSGAGTNYGVLGALPKGSSVSYSSESAGWQKSHLRAKPDTSLNNIQVRHQQALALVLAHQRQAPQALKQSKPPPVHLM